MLPEFRLWQSLEDSRPVARLDQKCHLLRAAVLLFGFILCFIWLAIRVTFGMKTHGVRTASAMI